jgi:membrane protein implicated in regulation of membrane protease activity
LYRTSSPFHKACPEPVEGGELERDFVSNQAHNSPLTTHNCYNIPVADKRLTHARLILAIISTGAEEVAIWAVWRWVLPDLDIYLHPAVLIAIMVAWAGFCAWFFIFTTKTLKKQAQVGLPSMVGMKGKAAGPLCPEGMVKIKGELWGAAAEKDAINPGEDVEVVGQAGLKLTVRRVRKPGG